MSDRRGFIRKCCKVLGPHRLAALAADVQAPPDDVLRACRSNRFRELALVHEEVSRVLKEAADRSGERRTPGDPRAHPRRPAGCLY